MMATCYIIEVFLRVIRYSGPWFPQCTYYIHRTVTMAHRHPPTRHTCHDESDDLPQVRLSYCYYDEYFVYFVASHMSWPLLLRLRP